MNESQLELPMTEQEQALAKSVPKLMDEQPQISTAKKNKQCSSQVARSWKKNN